MKAAEEAHRDRDVRRRRRRRQLRRVDVMRREGGFQDPLDGLQLGGTWPFRCWNPMGRRRQGASSWASPPEPMIVMRRRCRWPRLDKDELVLPQVGCAVGHEGGTSFSAARLSHVEPHPMSQGGGGYSMGRGVDPDG